MSTHRPAPFLSRLFDLALLALIGLGLIFRFAWVNWSQGTNLHPDEYGLTNTLTQLKLPKTLDGYFNTRLSPLSPYQKYTAEGEVSGGGPDNGMRWGQWPIIILRAAAELTHNTGYNEQRLLGRTLSALADALSILLIFLIGRRLYTPRIALLAAALSSLAALQIQQSHFMTVDNFAVLFSTLALYLAVRIAQTPAARRAPQPTGAQAAISQFTIFPSALALYALFGLAFGMAVASKINLLPVGGLLLVAALLSLVDVKLRSRGDLPRLLALTLLNLAVAGAAAGLTFRLTQPMSFRAPLGDTGLLTFHLNSDWTRSMAAASSESSGIGGGPPAEQWAHRIIILFPLVNQVVWGMGLPLGLASWAGLAGALWASLRRGQWRAHLIPLVWTGGYFFFMATRWVKSIRYFLPIYPFFALLAAWGLLALWQWAAARPRRRWAWQTLAGALLLAVTAGTLAWALAFVNAVYRLDHTRIQATRWSFQNIPSPFHLTLIGADGLSYAEPLSAPNGLQITPQQPYLYSFKATASGALQMLTIPHAVATAPARLEVALLADQAGATVLDRVEVLISAPQEAAPGPAVQAAFHQAWLAEGQVYYLAARVLDDQVVTISRTLIANENWDEGLPVPFERRDPYGQFYRGAMMEIRWYDDPNKRQMMLNVLEQADYLILPSQRAIWTTCRLPLTYPMTMAYYRALFDGRLGFKLVALFQSPLRLGPLQISDVGGTLAWGRAPSLPLFNHSQLAAEEAFSVYDHPPVWIFQKQTGFSLAQAAAILDEVDLSQVVVQSARNASGDYCP